MLSKGEKEGVSFGEKESKGRDERGKGKNESRDEDSLMPSFGNHDRLDVLVPVEFHSSTGFHSSFWVLRSTKSEQKKKNRRVRF